MGDDARLRPRLRLGFTGCRLTMTHEREDAMAQVIEELRRTVLALTKSVSSGSVRYRLREIHERLSEFRDIGKGRSSPPASDATGA